MEALARLQAVQATLQLMQEYSLCSDGRSSDRFVADFLLFLTQNCTEMEELSKRCVTLLQLLPKISMNFLQALVSGECTAANDKKDSCGVEIPSAEAEEGDEQVWEIGNCSSPTAAEIPEAVENRVEATSTPVEDCQLPTAGIACDEPTTSTSKAPPSVGLKAMEKARSTLEDFCRSYFMFHDMDVHNPQHVFRYLPFLQFVEAFIYQLDEDNEDKLQPSVPVVEIGALRRSSCQRSIDEPQVTGLHISEGHTEDASYVQSCSDEEMEASDSGQHELNLEVDPFEDLREVLYNKGLMTERIESEFRDGVEYWRLERKLCESITLGTKVTKEDVFRAITLKSFDYRVLNHLLYSLTHKMVVETHIEFLRVAELLVEIADDLFDYEDDVLKNSFNVLRMLIYICGPTEAPAVLANFISAEEAKYQQLLEKLEPSLARRFQERCREAVKEGGGVSKSGFWTIPPLIVDEAAFRAQLSCESAPYIREV